jgi:nucleoid DNA-binding protein
VHEPQREDAGGSPRRRPPTSPPSEQKEAGTFALHGFARFVVVKEPARPARKGINPFTKQEQTFAAKPASKAVRATPVKALKDAVA